ncbi:hypothetical protein H6G33_15465 [Calothrix sp. FACHB-1219]|uniref:AAA domain-containing protein n=1 Tax=unclassified Calothrix TaxID=2619626 RepID=UPI001682A6DE|nr:MULTISPECIES: AAA domain-containing protein [unclassified Calothrix]MBD2207386.1 hypothetical protein [Calothrix sp. FACHB-168]MBD2218433.1 hypothetical protein [Calothrix sp. FACHB-1219]
MNERQFWGELQQLIYQSNQTPEIAQAQWERLVQLHNYPTLPTQLIIQTICHGAVYLKERSQLNFPAINSNIPLSANQTLALEMALSNSAIALIVGSPATGKTRIAQTLAHTAINFSKRILLLTHHHSTLNAYRNLPGYPFWLNQQQDYQSWVIEQLYSQHLSQPQMDYLPLHLLPDRELVKLRTTAKLENWLPIIKNTPQAQLTEQLQPEFPDLTNERVKLLAYRLKQLEPLLQQQLKLSQLYANLSVQGVAELVSQISESPQIPVVGTVAEFMQIQHQSLWQNNFDLVIVEEAEYLSRIELILLSGLANKLILFGNVKVKNNHPSHAGKSFFSRFTQSFNYLNQHLLPSYRYQLTEQYRIHPEIFKIVEPVICDRWIHTKYSRQHYHIPQLTNRLIWHDVSNQQTSEKIIQFLHTLNSQISSQIGIVTFCTQARDWLKANSPTDFTELFIGTVAEWAGIERAIVIINCPENLENLTSSDINIALSRGQDYLILFGDFDFWRQLGSPLRTLLSQPELYKERGVVLS